MGLALTTVFFVVCSLGLAFMARRAWGWSDLPELSTFNAGSYAASLPGCLMSLCFVLVLAPALVVGRDTGSVWMQALAIVFPVVVVPLGVSMYSAFTYRRPRMLVPPVLRRD